MSGNPNKRLHEDTGGHSSVSRYDSGTKMSSFSVTNDPAQDNRIPKIPRSESRDADRRSPSLPMYRVPSSSFNDSRADHADDRVEPRDPKDSNRVENSDIKGDSREPYPGTKGGDKDVRFVNRGDDHKETKYDKDVYGSMTGHLSWKDPKEHHRAKKYPDTSRGNMDSWPTSRSNVHGLVEASKVGSVTEEKIYTEAHEAVGENKLDVKGEDKIKEKDRKRKDGKHRDWTERDKERIDFRYTLQSGNNINEMKDPMKDERGFEKTDRERKDFVKEKDKPKEREKDHTKREVWNGAEKDGLNIERESVDAGRPTEDDNSLMEQKKQKDPTSWKEVDKEQKDIRKDRETDVEGEGSETRSRCFEKDADDGGAVNMEGGAEREREFLNGGVQQRKRMPRPRGSPQLGNREPRFGNPTQDDDESAGRTDISTVIYRVGDCMQELLKLWKEYASSHPDKIPDSSEDFPTLEIRIPAEHVTATNRQVRGGQLWGTDVYTDDSDLVAVLMHTGYCRPTASPPPAAVQELRATVKVLPPQDCYISTLRNNVRSRAWGAAIGCSYRVERCCIVKKGGGTINLEPCLTHTSTVEPTLAPVVVERTMTTRAAASNALRQQRFVREVTIQYNLCNEPWIKYSISAVADKGLKKPLFTSARLKKGEVLYLESHSCRYELCFSREKMVNATPSASHGNDVDKEKYQPCGTSNESRMENDCVMMDVFRWSRCKKPLPQNMMRSIGIPLPLEHLEVLEDNVDWEDIQWSQTGVWIAGKEYPLARVHFLAPN